MLKRDRFTNLPVRIVMYVVITNQGRYGLQHGLASPGIFCFAVGVVCRGGIAIESQGLAQFTPVHEWIVGLFNVANGAVLQSNFILAYRLIADRQPRLVTRQPFVLFVAVAGLQCRRITIGGVGWCHRFTF